MLGSMDLIKTRPGILPRINIESDPNISSSSSSNHLSLGRVRDALACTKCRLCQKMKFHCRHCKHRCHKKCPGHMHHCVKKNGRRSGSSKIYTGDEHWTKVLQANEVISEVTSCPYHGRSRRGTDSASTSDRSPDWDCVRSTLRPPSSRSSKDPSSSPSTSSSSTTPNSIKDKTFLHAIYSRFCQWIDSARKDSPSLSRLRSTGGSPRNPSRRSSFGDGAGKVSPAAAADEIAFDLALLVDKAASVGGGNHYQRTVSSSDSELGSAGASYSSTCSSLTVTSTSTTTSDCCPSCGGGASSAQLSDCSNLDDGFLSDDVTFGVCAHCSGGATCPSVQHLASAAAAEARGLGWPRTSDDNRTTDANWYATSVDKEDQDERDGFDDIHISYYEEYLRDSLVDWNIPIGDVELVECLRKGVKHEVFRGRWHGDVFIYCFNGSSDMEVARFLREVTRLSKIRHENICLFMGACLQPPNLAVITSELKGISVYEKLHLSSDRIPMRSRVNIGRQVAQAMGYLHAKGITAQVLNSRNIYLEPKVKLSLLDQGMAERKNTRPNEICIPRGNLTYLAPEILRDLRVKCANIATCTYLSTVQTDVYAFGTLLYELFSGQFPLRGLRLEEILWQVCYGNRQTLANISCNTVLKVLIERCWASTPEDRPQFSEINQELQQKTGLHKRHSSSQPERLDRQNSFTDKCLL